MSSQSWVEYLPPLLHGAGLTVVVTFIAMAGGVIVGFALAMMKISPYRSLQAAAAVYGTLVRGLPLLIQILIIYFALPFLTGVRMPAITAGTVAMVIYTGGFMGEIIRAGIQAVESGQLEAARSIGFGYWSAMRLVVLPQAFWLMLPNVVNQFSITLKNTSLLSVIGAGELTMAGQTIYSLNFDTVRVLSLVGAIYLVIYLVVERLSAFVERRFAR